MAVETIGSSGGLQCFLENLAKAYVQRANIVLAYSTKSDPKDLQVQIDKEQYKLDELVVPQLFK